MDAHGAYWRCGVCNDVTNGAPRCALCARRHGRRWLWLKLLLALVIGLAWGLSCRSAFGGVEQQIQPLLDQGRTVKLAPNATYDLDAPLRLPSRARLIGGGFGTVLRFRGAGDWAVILGDAGLPAYAWELQSLAVDGGGVLVSRCSNRCRLRDVWIINARGPGLMVDGPGDRLVVEGLDVSRSGMGVLVRGRRANNGLVLRDCGMSGNLGPGLVAETVDFSSATLEGLLVQHCTIQGNGLGTVGQSADVVLSGAVTDAVFDHVHVESTFSGCGLRVEASGLLPHPVDARRLTSRSPSNVLLRNTAFQPTIFGQPAIEVRAMEGLAGTLRLEDCHLRMVIRIGAGVPAVEQVGPRRQQVEVATFQQPRPP